MRRCRWPATIPEAGAAAAPTCRRRGRDPAQVTEQPALRAAQPLPAPRRGHWIVDTPPGHHQILKQCPHRRHPPVHRRRRRRIRPDPIRGASPARPAHSLPIDPVEHHRRIDDGQSEFAFGQEPRQVQHVECVRAHRGRAEPAPAQVRQERIRRIQPVPVAVDPIPAIDLTHPHRHHPSRLPVRALSSAASTRPWEPLRISRRYAGRVRRGPVNG